VTVFWNVSFVYNAYQSWQKHQISILLDSIASSDVRKKKPLEPSSPSEHRNSFTQSDKTLPVGLAPTAKLHCSYFALRLFILHAVLTLYSWITICVLTAKPVGAQSYGYKDVFNTENYHGDPVRIHKIYVSSQ
jgi:hypothetical protein